VTHDVFIHKNVGVTYFQLYQTYLGYTNISVVLFI